VFWKNRNVRALDGFHMTLSDGDRLTIHVPISGG
jgi:molybdopterin converting factor small subunit